MEAGRGATTAARSTPARSTRRTTTSVFAAAEVVSPEAGAPRFTVGSDDTLIVWVKWQASLHSGNRKSFLRPRSGSLLKPRWPSAKTAWSLRCGNGNGEWMPGVAVAPPAAHVRSWRGSTRSAGPRRRRRRQSLARPARAEALRPDAGRRCGRGACGRGGGPGEAGRRSRRPGPIRRHAARRPTRPTARDGPVRGLNLPDAPAMQAETARQAEGPARRPRCPQGRRRPGGRQGRRGRAGAGRAADGSTLAQGRGSSALARAEAGGLKEAGIPRARRAQGRDRSAGGGAAGAGESAGQGRQVSRRRALGSRRASGRGIVRSAPLHPTNDPNRPTPTGA